MWTENILDTRLFESNDLTIIMWVPFPSTPRNNANFQQEPAKKGTDSYIISRNVDGKHAEIFSEWKSRLWSFSENVFVKFLKPNLDGGSGFVLFSSLLALFSDLTMIQLHHQQGELWDGKKNVKLTKTKLRSDHRSLLYRVRHWHPQATHKTFIITNRREKIVLLPSFNEISCQ